MRAIVKDNNDEYLGAESRVWLDSDAVTGSNDIRNTPRNNFTDGEWHMVTVTSQPNGKKVTFLESYHMLEHPWFGPAVNMVLDMRPKSWLLAGICSLCGWGSAC